MRDDVSDIADYYGSDPNNEGWRLERHQLEYDLTWRYLDTYLTGQGAILEIGAATGAYTLELARRGHEITAVDLSAELLDVCRDRITEARLEGQVRFVVADARDLGQITREPGFDVVLLMGPLYHLVLEADRKTALQEAFDRLRPGGIFVSSFISRFGIFGDLIKRYPEWIEDQERSSALLATGKRPEGYPKGGFRGYFAHVSEVAPLHEALGLKSLVVAGIEPAISADDESYNRLEDERRRLWLDLLYELSAEQSIIGASRHLLYIGRKE